ncbi:hypothetical protein GGI12_001780 [Dipsacomyces acuminosporus]|nr:hypothetical protein GGI12_001780 [Dipsacomyces acuminosporus]
MAMDKKRYIAEINGQEYARPVPPPPPPRGDAPEYQLEDTDQPGRSSVHSHASSQARSSSLPPSYQQVLEHQLYSSSSPSISRQPQTIVRAVASHYTGSPEGIRLQPGSYVEVEDAPAMLDCPHCKLPIITQIKSKTGTKTVVAAAAIALLFWPLAFLPFTMKSLKKKVHICPHCQKKIGKIVTVTAVQPVKDGVVDT